MLPVFSMNNLSLSSFTRAADALALAFFLHARMVLLNAVRGFLPHELRLLVSGGARCTRESGDRVPELPHQRARLDGRHKDLADTK